jgi:rhodanese-related sulfurtransferase
MIRKISVFILVVISVLLGFSSCSGNKTEKKPEVSTAVPTPSTLPSVKTEVKVGNETSLLLKDLSENGDYVNSQTYPSLIKATIVKENLGKNQLVIDIRPKNQFSEGHIKGAVNIKFEELPSYFEKGIKPFTFDKIIIVCTDGQLSCYTTCLLRLRGYGNVYAMRWGMSAWNKKYADAGWLSGLSGKFESKLEKTVNERSSILAMPELNTGKQTGKEIGDIRFASVFAEGTGNILITADEVFANPQKYFIINLERKDKYEDGHIPGAVRYKPEGTLGFPEEMGSIPADKTIVVYCGTGHNSGFATAFLRLFGYNAHTLKYGNNGFMHDRMVKLKTTLSWLPFSEADVNNFEVVK